MGMPTEPLLDVMRRSMANLKFVEENATAAGPYEVTQLLNTFLGALAHPFEAMRDDLNALTLAEAAEQGWPSLPKDRPDDQQASSLGDLVRLMRNAVAHGNVEFASDGQGQIGYVRLWNTHPRTRARTWGATVRVADMRSFLSCFVALIEERHKNFGWYLPRSA